MMLLAFASSCHMRLSAMWGCQVQSALLYWKRTYFVCSVLYPSGLVTLYRHRWPPPPSWGCQVLLVFDRKHARPSKIKNPQKSVALRDGVPAALLSPMSNFYLDVVLSKVMLGLMGWYPLVGPGPSGYFCKCPMVAPADFCW